MIDWGQVLPWLLGIIGIVIGGWKTQVAAKAEADKKTAEADAAKTTADAETQSAMTALAQRQQTLLEEIQKNNRSRDRAIAKQLSRISGLFNDIRNGEVNVHNALTTLIQSQGAIVTAVNGIPQAVTAAMMAGIAEANKNEIKELGRILRSEMALDRYEREGYRFPAAEDPEWIDDILYPLEPEVVIHKGPYYDSDVQLQKPCAKINPQGERVRLIANRHAEFVIVDKVDDGMRCWGYVPRKKVRIGAEVPVAL